MRGLFSRWAALPITHELVDFVEGVCDGAKPSGTTIRRSGWTPDAATPTRRVQRGKSAATDNRKEAR